MDYNYNRVTKNRLDNYLIPPLMVLLINSRLTHIDPKLYTKCPPWPHLEFFLSVLTICNISLVQVHVLTPTTHNQQNIYLLKFMLFVC